MNGCKASSRNDLLVNSPVLEFGTLVVQFQDTAGFTVETRERGKYRLIFRLDNIPNSFEPRDVFLKAKIYLDSTKGRLLYEGDWIGGSVAPREKYRDWLIGRYLNINLMHRDYYMEVLMSDNPSEDQNVDSDVIKLEVTAKRIFKDPVLGLF